MARLRAVALELRARIRVAALVDLDSTSLQFEFANDQVSDHAFVLMPSLVWTELTRAEVSTEVYTES